MLAEEPRGLTLGFLDDDETEIVGRGGVEEDLAVVYIGGFFCAIFLRLIMVPVLYETLETLGIRRAESVKATQ